MNRVRVLLILLLLPLSVVSGQGAPSVFLDTDPLEARIQVDGLLIADRTPALLRGLAPGTHTVAFWHEGYALAIRTFQVAAGPVPSLEVDLVPDSLVLAFPSNPAIADGTSTQETARRQFRFPAGTYRLESDTATARLIPAFPDEGLLTVAGWALVLASGSAVLSGAADAGLIYTGWADHPSILTGALVGTALFELPWFLSLSGRQARFVKETAPTISPQAQNLDQAKPLWEQGEAALQAGDLSGAEVLFSRFVRDQPGSRLVPGAWFRLARIHSVTGRRDLALGEYRLVANTYPQVAYHDRARKVLADLYEAAGDPTRALENLDALVPDDGLFDQADLDAQRARLTSALETPHAP